MKKWTLSEIKAANERGGFFFFTRDTMKFFHDTMKSFGVRHIDGAVYVYRKLGETCEFMSQRNFAKPPAVWVFNPETGDLDNLPKDQWPAGIYA